MSKRGDVIVDGQKIQRIRDAKLMTQEDFADVIGVNRSWVYATEKQGQRRVLRKRLVEIAERLDLRPEDLVVTETVTVPEDVINNVHPGLRRLAEIPTFTLPLSAIHWSEVEGMRIVSDPRSIDQGLFRVWIKGECMVPRYSDGDLVEFKIITPTDICTGDEVYIQRSDHLATFKSVYEVNNNGIILSPLNPIHSHLRMPVTWDEIARAATAVGKFVVMSKPSRRT